MRFFLRALRVAADGDLDAAGEDGCGGVGGETGGVAQNPGMGGAGDGDKEPAYGGAEGAGLGG